MSIRAGCCGKKRKASQLKWIEGYDGGSWRCKEGFGCRKPNRCNKPSVVKRSEPLIEEQCNWLMLNTSLEVEKIVDFKERFK